MTDIKIGQHVMVVDADQQYTTYDRWASLNKLRNYERGFRCESGFNGVVTAIANHSTYQNRVLIAVCGDGHEIIINIEGVKKVENTSCGMKPIKRGMTEAVTRDGRKVTQLTWFDDVEGAYCLYGVLDDGCVKRWTAGGKYYQDGEEANLDLFAPVEYEWQWLVKSRDGRFFVSAYRDYPESYAGTVNSSGEVWHSRIEESKREVKE